MDRNWSSFFAGATVVAVILVGGPILREAVAQSVAAAAPAEKPYLAEWVYRVKYGYKDEFFEIFKKYQIPILDREKELGYVTRYSIYSPSLHATGDSRWDYRVIITYRDQESAGHSAEVTRQLFPNTAVLKREENRRWELTETHWDLPIHLVDANGSE